MVNFKLPACVLFMLNALMASLQCAFAVDPPSGGSQLQQIPPVPVLQQVLPEIQIERGIGAVADHSDDATVKVSMLHVTGQTLYTENELMIIAEFSPGNELTLSDLRSMAKKIANFYHKNGYFVAQVYLPQQDIIDGNVAIVVMEGRYGKVTLLNKTPISDGVIDMAGGLQTGLKSGEIIDINPLENRLLLLSDLPGVRVSSTLMPGPTVGTSDLLVDIRPGERVSGNVEVDNEGNRYTGANRAGATVYVNEPFGLGDVLSLRTLESVNGGLDYGRVNYQVQAGIGTVGVAYAALVYRLGDEFDHLHANGTADIASLFSSYPLIRSRTSNLNLMLDFDDKTFHDNVDSTSSVTSKNAYTWNLSLYGDGLDTVGRGGSSHFSIMLTSGELDIRSPDALASDAVSTKTDGHYEKLTFNLARIQKVGEMFSLYAAIDGQLASKNLDISEQMELGGAYAVRAYPEGETYFDQGYVVNLEARMLLPRLSESMIGNMQFIGFVDTGTATLRKNPSPVSDNTRTLSGAGLELSWEAANDFSVNVYWAHKLGDAMAISAPDSVNRFWIQCVKFF